MGFRSVLSKAVQSGIKLTGDLAESVTLRQPGGTASYDATTGTSTPDYTDLTVTAVLIGYKAYQVDGDHVVQGDMKALIAKADLGALDLDTDALLVRGDTTWEVKDIMTPTGDALVTLQIRRT